MRKELHLISIQLKIEKGSMEGLGPRLQIPIDKRVTKVTSNSLNKLEEAWNPNTKYRCTSRHWIKIMCETSVDQLEMKDNAMNRKNWKAIIRNWMSYLELWKELLEKGWEGDKIERSQRTKRINSEPEQGKRTLNLRPGIKTRTRRKHTVNESERMQKMSSQLHVKLNLKNHDKKCSGKTICSINERMSILQKSFFSRKPGSAHRVIQSALRKKLKWRILERKGEKKEKKKKQKKKKKNTKRSWWSRGEQ